MGTRWDSSKSVLSSTTCGNRALGDSDWVQVQPDRSGQAWDTGSGHIPSARELRGTCETVVGA